MKNKTKKDQRSFLWLILLLVASVLLLGSMLYQQNPNQFLPRQENSNPPDKLSKERGAFGSILSPDGNWRVVARQSGEHTKSVTHELELSAVREKNTKTVLMVTEQANGTDQMLPGTTEWDAVGWSPDGKKVYYVTQRTYLGGFDGQPAQTFGDKLYEVELGTKKALLINDLRTSSILGEGYLDVYPQKDRVLYLVDGKLFLNRLRGDDKTPLENPEVKQGIISPSGEKIAVIVMKDLAPEKGLEELKDEDFKWYYGVIDAKTGRYQQLGEGADLKRWIDDHSFLIGDKVIKL